MKHMEPSGIRGTWERLDAIIADRAAEPKEAENGK